MGVEKILQATTEAGHTRFGLGAMAGFAFCLMARDGSERNQSLNSPRVWRRHLRCSLTQDALSGLAVAAIAP